MTALLEVKNLAKSFPVTRFGDWLPRRTSIRAVAGVDFTLDRGECLALIGESGSGKSTLARCLVRFLTADRGEVRLDGVNLLALSAADFRRARRRVQLLFQDSSEALDPRFSAADSVNEALAAAGVSSEEMEEERVSLFVEMGLAEDLATRYPHQLSGGQRQRVALARALAAQPDLLILDEPIASLDASLRQQVMLTLERRRKSSGIAQILIGHNLAAAALADRVAVMYLGHLVELGPARRVLESPQHPYTAALLASRPSLDLDGPPWQPMLGESPSAENPPSGCVFHPRCPRAEEKCTAIQPDLRMKPPSRIACFNPLPPSAGAE